MSFIKKVINLFRIKWESGSQCVLLSTLIVLIAKFYSIIIKIFVISDVMQLFFVSITILIVMTLIILISKK